LAGAHQLDNDATLTFDVSPTIRGMALCLGQML
jgi:hypothetical protein